MMTNQGVLSKRTTDAGDRFIAFITNPSGNNPSERSNGFAIAERQADAAEGRIRRMTLPGSTIDDEAAVTEVLADYYKASSTLEVQSVLPYFHEPSLLIGPQGVFAAPTNTDLVIAFAPVIESLRAREYGRSDLSLRSINVLSTTAAVVTGVAIRYKLNGEELEQVGVTYVLHRTDGRWKIAVLIIHDAEMKSINAKLAPPKQE
jgi:hypothetical protein